MAEDDKQARRRVFLEAQRRGAVTEYKDKEQLNSAERIGYMILLLALEKPLRQIAENAGEDPGVAVMKVKESKGNAGYNALTDRPVVDMVAEGIVDPVKVTRTALERAASAAAILLTTEAAIADEPKDEKDSPMPGGGMGDMDY